MDRSIPSVSGAGQAQRRGRSTASGGSVWPNTAGNDTVRCIVEHAPKTPPVADGHGQGATSAPPQPQCRGNFSGRTEHRRTPCSEASAELPGVPPRPEGGHRIRGAKHAATYTTDGVRPQGGGGGSPSMGVYTLPQRTSRRRCMGRPRSLPREHRSEPRRSPPGHGVRGQGRTSAKPAALGTPPGPPPPVRSLDANDTLGGTRRKRDGGPHAVCAARRTKPRPTNETGQRRSSESLSTQQDGETVLTGPDTCHGPRPCLPTLGGTPSVPSEIG